MPAKEMTLMPAFVGNSLLRLLGMEMAADWSWRRAC
jgi:hypothetical protein